MQVGTYDESMRLKEHAHIFVNTGGKLGALDFRMGGVGAPFNGLKAFATTEQLGLYDKMMNAVRYVCMYVCIYICIQYIHTD
jgi:zeta-carotene desaturase